MNAELWEMVDRKFRQRDIDGAVQALETFLEREHVDHFKGLVGARFTNPPHSVLLAIGEFLRTCQARFDVQAVYLEMNGFDVNWDRWFFALFGYGRYVDDPDDLEWLCDWQSEDSPTVTLTGLEAVQKDFAWYHANEIWKDQRYERAYDLAVLLVMVKFVTLIQSALQSGKLTTPVPVLATAHDFDIVGRFVPERDPQRNRRKDAP